LECRSEMMRDGYSLQVVRRAFFVQREFLKYLADRNASLETASPAHVRVFLRLRLARYQRRHGRMPSDPIAWIRIYRPALHRLLRKVRGQWPPHRRLNPQHKIHEGLLKDYGEWLLNVRGAAQATVDKDFWVVRGLFRWSRSRQIPLAALDIAAIDEYFAWRMPKLRRATRKGVCNSLRSFLRYLYASKQIRQDLAQDISGPILYRDAEIPRAFSSEQIKRLLEVTRRDHSPQGLRDYAILLLLATYGLRGGEVARLSLDDIDWRGDKFRVRRSKTYVESYLPLFNDVGAAVVRYLQRGRPKTEYREIFLRNRAPIRPFVSASAVSSIITSRLQEAGIKVQGRHGSHAFRFARATSLLRGSVSLKTIGDVLGHRTEDSTRIYLRLGTEDLRAISLEVPGGRHHARMA
jgi:integrase/recombinase XerD